MLSTWIMATVLAFGIGIFLLTGTAARNNEKHSEGQKTASL
jgi:hypothetical protein